MAKDQDKAKKKIDEEDVGKWLNVFGSSASAAGGALGGDEPFDSLVPSFDPVPIVLWGGAAIVGGVVLYKMAKG